MADDKQQKDATERTRETRNRDPDREGPVLNKRYTGARKHETHEEEQRHKPLAKGRGVSQP